MAIEEIAKHRWKLPLDEWSPLCDNHLELDRIDAFENSPHKMNQFGLCSPPECNKCVTAKFVLPDPCDIPMFPKHKRRPIIECKMNGGWASVVSGGVWNVIDPYNGQLIDLYEKYLDPISGTDGVIQSISGRLGIAQRCFMLGTCKSGGNDVKKGAARRFASFNFCVYMDVQQRSSYRFRATLSHTFGQYYPSPFNPGQVLSSINYAYFSVIYESLRIGPPFIEPEPGQTFVLGNPSVIHRESLIHPGFITFQLPPGYLTYPGSLSLRILGY